MCMQSPDSRVGGNRLGAKYSRNCLETQIIYVSSLQRSGLVDIWNSHPGLIRHRYIASEQYFHGTVRFSPGTTSIRWADIWHTAMRLARRGPEAYGRGHVSDLPLLCCRTRHFLDSNTTPARITVTGSV